MSNPHIHNKSYLDDLHTSLAYLLTNTKHWHSRQNKMKLHCVHTQWMSVQYWRIYEASLCMTQQNVQHHDSTFVSFTFCFWAHTASDLIMVNCLWPPSVQNHLKIWFTYNNITEKIPKIPKKSIIKNVIVQKLWVMENFDCIFEFIVKSYVRFTINLSCAKIVFPNVIFRISLPTLNNLGT